MAEILIKMGVSATEKDVDGILNVLDYIYKQDSEKDKESFIFSAYEENFSNGAIGVLASMSIVLTYIGNNGKEKTYIRYLLKSFNRIVEDGKPAILMEIPSESRQLIRIIYEQRNREDNDILRSQYVQEKAEEYGLI